MANACAGGMASSPTQLTYYVTATSAQPYIDLASLLSRQNHRLYRQGMVYHVRVQVANGNTTGQRDISVAKNTWAIHKAHALAKKSWMQSTADERANGVRPGRWNDFRVFLEAAHTEATTVDLITGNGEYNYTIANAATTSAQYQFHLYGSGSGGSPGRFGVLREYDDMRDTDTDTPAAAATAMPYSVLQAELSNNQADLLQEEGDLPPYDAVDLEDGTGLITYQLHAPSSGPEPWVTNTQGFIPVPCGLIRYDGNLENAATYRIDFKPGKYKGVHAEVMG